MRDANNYAKELWINDQNGNAKRISVDLQQQADSNAPLKTLSALKLSSDYVFYAANPGADNQAGAGQPSNAPRNVYMANWNGENWQIGPSPTVALASSPVPTLQRSSSGCSTNTEGRYVAVSDRVTSQDFNDLYVYDTVTKARVGTATVNPAGTAGCQSILFTPDQSALIFSCVASASDSNQELFFFSMSGASAATKISLAYPTPNVNAFPLTLTFEGDFFMWRQEVAPGGPPAFNGIVVYNWKTRSGPTILFTETATLRLPISPIIATADIESTNFVISMAGRVSSLGASVWFSIVDSSGPLKTALWRAALNGAANSALRVVDTEDVKSVVTRKCGGTACSGGPGANTCREFSQTCSAVSTCCSQMCSGWVTWLGRPAGSSQWQIYSALHDGSSVTVTALATTECTLGVPLPPVIWELSIGHPFASPLRPFIYFTATDGVIGSEVQNLYAVQAGSATVINIGAPVPVPRGGVWPGPGPSQICDGTGSPIDVPGNHAQPALSPDGKWIIYQSQTVASGICFFGVCRSVAETFLALADGSVAPKKIGPLANHDFTASKFGGSLLLWSSDSTFAIFGMRSQYLDVSGTALATFDRQRDELWSVEASTAPAPKTYNLTAISNVDLVNSVRDGSGYQFHPCNNRELVFSTKLPTTTSPPQVYKVAVTGGNTVRLSQSNVAASLLVSLTVSNTVLWQSQFFDSGLDIFSAGTVPPPSGFGTLNGVCPSSNATVGIPYSSSVVATGAAPPAVFSVVSPDPLPANLGVTLNPSSGAIIGTPTGATSSEVIVTFKITDARNFAVVFDCPLNVAPAPSFSSTIAASFALLFVLLSVVVL